MNYLNISILGFLALFFVSCSGGNMEQEMDTNQQENEAPQENSFTELVSVLHATEGNDVSGVVRFSQSDEGVRVEAEVTGLEPNSTHGFHVHEFGDCTATDGTSAGGHFNPEDQPHAGPESAMRHIGDLGNITADDEGVAEADFVDPMLTFNGPNNILGRGVIVHAGEDDLESQPTGDAGSRMTCGVIGVAQQ